MEENQTIKKRSLIEIALIHFALIFICWTLVIIFGQIVSTTILFYKKMPVLTENMSIEEIKTINDKILAEIKSEYENGNTEKLQEEQLEYMFMEKPSLLLWNNIGWALCFIIPGYFLFKKLSIQINLFNTEFQPESIFQGLNYGILLFIMISVISLLIKLLNIEPSPIAAQAILFRSLFDNTNLLVWSLYSVGLITGVLEELFFRGYLLENYIQEGYHKEGLFITSIVFGFIHYTPESSIIVPIILSIAGAFFGWVYMHTKSLWVTAFTHAFFNSAGLVMAYFIEQK